MTLAKDVLNQAHGAAVFKRRIRVLSEALADKLGEEGSVLDVGCGDGTLAQAVMAIKPRLRFEGVDVFLRPQVAIPAREYDGKRLPFPDGAFDWTMIVDVLHHTDDPAGVLAECARVSRRGIVIKDHLREGFLARPVLEFMDWVGNRGHGVRLPYNYLSKPEWDAIFSRLEIQPHAWTEKLGLYPLPFGAVFDRRLHFVARLVSRSDDAQVG